MGECLLFTPTQNATFARPRTEPCPDAMNARAEEEEEQEWR